MYMSHHVVSSPGGTHLRFIRKGPAPWSNPLSYQPRSVLGSIGVVLMSCKVNFHLVRLALHSLMCLLVTFLLIRSSSDPTFVGIFVCMQSFAVNVIKNGYPIRIPSIKKWYPFHKPSLESCTTFKYSKCIVFKSQNQNVFSTFSQP